MNRLIRNFAMGLLTLVVVAGCSANSGSTPNQRGGQASRAVPVEVTKVEEVDFSVPVSLSGRLEASQAVDVVSKATGRVKQVMVKVGDFVKAGQPIIALDGEEMQIEMQRAEASLLSSKARYTSAIEGTDEETLAQSENTLKDLENKYEAAKLELERSEALYREGAISSAEIEQVRMALSTAQINLENQKQRLNLEKKGPSQAELDAANAELKQAEADYALAKLNMQNMTILAPIDGIVGSVAADVGANVSNNGVVGQIVNMETMMVLAKVSEGQVGQFEVGQPVQVTISSADLTVEGAITSVSPVADSTKAYPIEIEIPNQDMKAKAGMVASIEVQGVPRRSLVVPREAVVTRGADSYVFIVEEEKAKQIQVTTGETDGERVEIVTGLQGGEDVVVQGQNTLVTEAAVTVIGPNQPQESTGSTPENNEAPAGTGNGQPAAAPGNRSGNPQTSEAPRG